MRCLTIGLFCITFSVLTGCSGGAGRCVGIAPASGDTRAGDVVLVNIDKDGLALQGYDPVAYFTDGKPVKGSPMFRASRGGAVYQFASADHKAMFEANPTRFEPQFGGYCAYAASINTISPISPDYWEVVDGRLILQHNQNAWNLWKKSPADNLVKADKNWPGLVKKNGAPPRSLVNVDANGLALEGHDPVAYFADGMPRKGDPAIERTYQGATYRFASIDHKNLFEKDPTKYVPQFGGFCGYAASINKVSPVDPALFQIVEGRLVLQHTQEAYDRFNEDPASNYAKAERNWPGLSARRCR